MVAQDTINCK